LRWYTLAAEQGYAHAQFNLGWMYDEGVGVEKNKAEAVRWYTQAAERGDADAQAALDEITKKSKKPKKPKQ
jgi:TPR repeat protein